MVCFALTGRTVRQYCCDAVGTHKNSSPPLAIWRECRWHPGKLLLSHGSLCLFFIVAMLTAKIRAYEEHLQRHPKVTISNVSPHVWDSSWSGCFLSLEQKDFNSGDYGFPKVYKPVITVPWCRSGKLLAQPQLRSHQLKCGECSFLLLDWWKWPSRYLWAEVS